MYVTLTTHLNEIKYRLAYTILSYIVTFAVIYNYSNAYIKLLVYPMYNLGQSNMIYTHISEAFMTHMYTSVYFSFGIWITYLIYQILCFILPGTTTSEASKYKYTLCFFIVYSFLAVYCGYKVIPYVLQFFMLYGVQEGIVTISLEARILPYMYTSMYIVILTYVAFMSPLIGYSLGMLINTKTLTHSRPYIWCGSLLFGALISPPDLVSQLMLAIVFSLMYESFMFGCILKHSYINLRLSPKPLIWWNW